MYEKDGKYYTEKEFFELNPDLNESSKDLPLGWDLREAGELVDFITNELWKLRNLKTSWLSQTWPRTPSHRICGR